MRKFIIDSDTAADDAVALLIAASTPQIEILGITTVCGNVPLQLATKNALQVVETANADIPIFEGSEKPLKRELYTAKYVHGNDGLGDCDLAHPESKAQSTNAVDYIVDTVKSNPDTIEIIALGPATNIACAILKSPEVMKRVKRIWSMGTAGHGGGNVTPFAEFNVYVDAESYDIMLRSGIPLTIIGLDMCTGDSALKKDELEKLSALSKKGEFVYKCTGKIVEHNISKSGRHAADIPDAVAVACALWSDTVKQKQDYYCLCSTKHDDSYGAVTLSSTEKPNATVITEFDSDIFKRKLFKALL